MKSFGSALAAQGDMRFQPIVARRVSQMPGDAGSIEPDELRVAMACHRAVVLPSLRSRARRDASRFDDGGHGFEWKRPSPCSVDAFRWGRTALLAALALLPLAPCHAALYDEIQVYTDDINEPGKFGLELHVNTTPRGRSEPAYAGEAVPNRGWRVTPEFSYGLSRDFEAGLYLPISRERGGSTQLAGAKVRLKWVPLHAQDHGGWFFGLNGELSRLKRRYAESRDGFELRTMLGWRNARWLFAVNPVLGWDLSPGFRGNSPETGLSTKVARTLGDSGFAVGLEHYAGLGTLARTAASGQQASTLYTVVDYGGHGWDLNFGVGRGLTSASDAWSIKAIVGFPF